MVEQWKLILHDDKDTSQPRYMLNLGRALSEETTRTLVCEIDSAELTHAVLSLYPGLMEMLEFASGKVETASAAVEKEIAEYETRIAKTFDGLRIVNDEYRALTDTRDRLTRASAKHARTLGEYRRLKAIMEPQDYMATPEAQ